MSLKHKILLGAVAAVIGFGALSFNTSNAAIAKDDKGPVVAIVNDHKIFRKDVMDVLNSVPMQKNASLEKIYPMVIDQMINETLVGNAAKAVVKSDDPEVLKLMKYAKEGIIRDLYIQRQLKNSVTDKKVKAKYDELKKKQKGKKEVHARHILVKTEEEAKTIIKELDDGAKFADLASKKTLDAGSKANGGDLGFFVEEMMVPEFSKAAFATKKGKYTKTPVKSAFGWHVIFVEAFRDVKVPEMKALEGQIKAALRQEAEGKMVKSLRKKAEIKRFSIDGQPLN